jgi:hypothetical protein
VSVGPSDNAGHPGEGEIPLDLPAGVRPGPTRPARESLLTARPDACPNCARPMSQDAVVCFACGYDQRQARVVTPEVGVVEVTPPTPQRPELEEFVLPGRGSARVVAVVGVVVGVAAMITAASIGRGYSTGARLALAAGVGLSTLIHTGTGLVAVWTAAKITGRQLERNVDLGAARMLVAFASLQLVMSLRLGIENLWLRAPVFGVALGAYWVVLFALFRRSHRDTTVLAACHVTAWLAVEFGVQVQAWLQSAALPPAPAG